MLLNTAINITCKQFMEWWQEVAGDDNHWRLLNYHVTATI
jgi:hypothetical protein